MKQFAVNFILVVSSILLLSQTVSAQGVLDQPTTSLAWESWRNLSDAEYEAKIDNLKVRGFRPIDVEVEDDSQRRYATIWRENSDNRKWIVKTKLTDSQFRDAWDTYKNQGYRPADQETHVFNGIRYYGAIWIENKEGLRWYSYRGLTTDEFHEKFDELKGSYIPVDVDTYKVSNQVYYAVIWVENKENIKWAIKRNMSGSAFNEEVEQRTNAGYRIYDIEVYDTGNGLQYAAIFVKEATPRKWYWRYGADSDSFHNYWTQYKNQGYRIEDVEIYSTKNGIRYAGIWVKNGNQNTQSGENSNSKPTPTNEGIPPLPDYIKLKDNVSHVIVDFTGSEGHPVITIPKWVLPDLPVTPEGEKIFPDNFCGLRLIKASDFFWEDASGKIITIEFNEAYNRVSSLMNLENGSWYFGGIEFTGSIGACKNSNEGWVFSFPLTRKVNYADPAAHKLRLVINSIESIEFLNYNVRPSEPLFPYELFTPITWDSMLKEFKKLDYEGNRKYIENICKKYPTRCPVGKSERWW